MDKWIRVILSTNGRLTSGNKGDKKRAFFSIFARSGSGEGESIFFKNEGFLERESATSL